MKNSPVALILALAVGLLIGLAGGAVLFGAPPTQAADELPVAVSSGSAPARSNPSSQRPSVAAPQMLASSGGGAAAASDELSGVDQQRVRTAAREVQRSEAGQVAASVGAGALTGRVEGLDGTGLAEVIVRLSPQRMGEALDPSAVLEDSGGKSMEELLNDAAEDALRARRERREVVTDALGDFRFDGLPEGDWSISAFLEGYSIQPVNRSQWRVPTGSDVLFRAESYRGVAIEVTRADGSVPAEAVIQATYSRGRGETNSFFAWTPESPELLLAPNGYSLRAFSDLLPTRLDDDTILGEWMSEEVEVYVGDEAVEPVQLAMEATNAIHGTVRFAAGFSSQDSLRLYVQAFAGDEPPDAEALDRDNGEWINSGGDFVRRELEPGKFLVAVMEGWNGSLIAKEVVDYAGGILRQDLLVSRGEGDQEVRLSITTPDGMPVMRAEMMMRTRTGRRSSGSGLNATFRDGAYVFPFPPKLLEPSDDEITVTVMLQDDRYAPASVEIVPGVYEYSMVAEEPASILVTITGYGDEEMRSRLRVQVDEIQDDAENQGWSFDGEGWIDERGQHKAEGKSPGRYRVSLFLARDRNQWWNAPRVADTEVVIGSGETQVTLPMPVLHSFTVRAPGFADGTSFSLNLVDDEQRGPWGRGTRAQLENGEVDFDDVPPGTYDLAVADSSGQKMTIEVPCGDITFEGRVPNASEVVVEDQEGLLATIGLATGDLIVSVDGADLGIGGLAGRAASLLRQKSGEHTVTVLRNGQEQTLSWSAVELGSLSFGGSLNAIHVDR